MINDGINNIPENKIVAFIDEQRTGFTYERLSKMLEIPDKKRDWFDKWFYNCLPLIIGNQYGFIIKSEYSFGWVWDGSESPEGTQILLEPPIEKTSNLFPSVFNRFGHGTLILELPFFLKTPPGVNLLVMNPTNYVIPNITVLTGVVESDNLRRSFNVAWKIQQPNIPVFMEKGFPIATILPIPRYFVDKFSVEKSEDIFSLEIVKEEITAASVASDMRDILKKESGTKRLDKDYMLGRDVFGNRFLDHQKTIENN
jgi:hypothetical protein